MQGINTFRSYVSGWYEGDLHEILLFLKIHSTNEETNLF